MGSSEPPARRGMASCTSIVGQNHQIDRMQIEGWKSVSSGYAFLRFMVVGTGKSMGPTLHLVLLVAQPCPAQPSAFSPRVEALEFLVFRILALLLHESTNADGPEIVHWMFVSLHIRKSSFDRLELYCHGDIQLRATLVGFMTVVDT